MSDGITDETSFVDKDGDRWHLDEYGDRVTHVGLFVMDTKGKVINLIRIVILFQLGIVGATIFGCFFPGVNHVIRM